MLRVKKIERLAFALSEQEYNALVDITRSKKITISEFVILQLSTAMHSSNFNADAERTSGKKKVVTVRVSEGMLDLVSEFAAKHNCSRNALLISAIKFGLNNVKKG